MPAAKKKRNTLLFYNFLFVTKPSVCLEGPELGSMVGGRTVFGNVVQHHHPWIGWNWIDLAYGLDISRFGGVVGL